MSYWLSPAFDTNLAHCLLPVWRSKFRQGSGTGNLHMPEYERSNKATRSSRGIKHFLGILGPGLVTGASDDNPSGLATYAMAGASLGYLTLWTALVTYPLMAG